MATVFASPFLGSEQHCFHELAAAGAATFLQVVLLGLFHLWLQRFDPRCIEVVTIRRNVLSVGRNHTNVRGCMSCLSLGCFLLLSELADRKETTSLAVRIMSWPSSPQLPEELLSIDREKFTWSKCLPRDDTLLFLIRRPGRVSASRKIAHFRSPESRIKWDSTLRTSCTGVRLALKHITQSLINQYPDLNLVLHIARNDHRDVTIFTKQNQLRTSSRPFVGGDPDYSPFDVCEPLKKALPTE